MAQRPVQSHTYNYACTLRKRAVASSLMSNTSVPLPSSSSSSSCYAPTRPSPRRAPSLCAQWPLRRCAPHALRGTAAPLARPATAGGGAGVRHTRSARLRRTPAHRAARCAPPRRGRGARLLHGTQHSLALLAAHALWLTSPLGQGRTRPARVATALQAAPRGGALVASAGEVGEAHGGAVYKDAFFNRAAELKSLATLLAGPPRAVLVLTGPPSCGKSGVCAPWFCRFCLGLC